MQQIANVYWLALSDYRHEWRMSFCFILALAAVLAPMMVLFGLKFGIVSQMADELVQDPANREIRPIGSGHYTPAWFDALAAQPGVGFLVPKTRAIAATLDLQNQTLGRIESAEMIPTGAADPVLPADMQRPQGYRSVVLSTEAARKLALNAGDTVNASLVRRFQGQRERAHLTLAVIGVAPPNAFPRIGAFVSHDLLVAAEDFRDGRAVPELGWSGAEALPDSRAFPGFRLYARSIDDVAPLRDYLEAQGVTVRTQAARIETVKRIDRNLTVIFWIIATVGLVGFALSLGASLWANVDRKRKELSVLRLVGFQSTDIVFFPVLQSLFTGVLGWALAAAIYAAIEIGINGIFPDQTICRLLLIHYLGALLLTLMAASLAAMLGGLRAANIEPSEGLRAY